MSVLTGEGEEEEDTPHGILIQKSSLPWCGGHFYVSSFLETDTHAHSTTTVSGDLVAL